MTRRLVLGLGGLAVLAALLAVAWATRPAVWPTAKVAEQPTPAPELAAVTASPSPVPDPTPIPPPAIPPTPSSPSPVAGPTPEPGGRVRVARTDGQGVNLRAEPGTSAARIKSLREGAELEVLGPASESDGRAWRHVRVPADGATGWVADEFLE